MKKLIHARKPSDKKSIKANVAKKHQPDVIYLGELAQGRQSYNKPQVQ